MKLHKLIVLTVVLLLPAQGLLADNVKGLSQYGVAGSVKKAPAKTTNKLKMVAPIGRGVVAANPVANSGPAIQKLAVPIGELKIARPQPSDPNLMVASIAWNDEFCVISCPEVAQDLKLAKATCGVSVRIINNGGTAIENSFRIKLDWTNHRGESESRVKIINSMGANEARAILFTAQDIWYYKTNRPFTITLDDFNVIPETNENDNIKSFSPQ